MKLLFVIFLSAIHLFISAQSDVGKRMDAYMQYLEKEGFAGNVLCIKGDEQILEKGYGMADRENFIPNATGTVFTIGSITKQFTAAAILKLEMLGKLSTSELMSTYISDVPADKSAITLHHLLTMSSGFPEAMGHDYDVVKRADFIKMAMNAPLVFEPGSSYLYSNVSYSILGAIVELVSGTDYETFCRTYLWHPAGMYETGYVQPEWKPQALSVGYTREGERWGTSLERPWDLDGPYWHLKCNGGVLSTARDMYMWYRALKKDEILDANAKKKMYTPWIAEGEGAPSYYGYGWSIVTTLRNTKLITHNGGNGVFFADYLNFEDEDVFVFIQSNASKEGMQDVAWELGRMINIPDYKPELRSYTLMPVTLQEAEQACGCTTVSALIDCIAGNGESLETFLQHNLGPGFLNAFPIEEHIAVFSDVRKDLAGMKVESIYMAGEELQLRYADDQGKELRLNISLNEAGKIRGLRLAG